MTYGGGGERITLSPSREGGKRMRKGTTMVVALAALLVAIFATAAYALDTINCTGGPCYGTDNVEFFDETAGNDQIYGYGGDDALFAYFWGDDTDKLYGGSNNDDLIADDGDGMDVLVGGKGKDDFCQGDVGDKFKQCDGNVTRVQ
jgi:Ca2+-binding RTX toxin-like protein